MIGHPRKRLRWWRAERDGSGPAGVRRAHVKRFAPRLWTAAFPRPMLAAVRAPEPGVLRAELAFLKRNDLAGLVWESVDRWSHPLLAYGTDHDYSGCALRFRWRSGPGVMPLDAVNGATLTVEGRDADGMPATWYVRLWNYAVGTPADAVVTLPFDALDAGFLLPAEARRVHPREIERLSISLVPAGYDGVDAALPARVDAWVELSELRCDGDGTVLSLGDAFLPEHPLRMCSGYDDGAHQCPERLVEQWFALGCRGIVNHYVGMSHFPALQPDNGRPDGGPFLAGAGEAVAPAARAWHRGLATACAKHGLRLILSLSFELLAAYCPDAWAQRDHAGAAGLTGWSPPSALLSPCNGEAVEWLAGAAAAFVGDAAAAGAAVDFQVGEPWWWVGPDKRPCFYDAATAAAWVAEAGAPPPVIADVRGAKGAAERGFMRWLGARLAAAARAVADAGVAAGAARRLLLFYAPQVLDRAAPDLRLANMPDGWAAPEWDVLQLEDYTYVTAGDEAGMAAGRAAAAGALGYPPARRHYLAGFVLDAADAAAHWPRIMDAADAALGEGVAEVFVWAWPQVARDGLTPFIMEEPEMAFHDVAFPLPPGLGAGGGPTYRTGIAALASGHELRDMGWDGGLCRFDAGPGVRSEADLRALLNFFRARRGAAFAFRFRDPMDHASAMDSGTPGALDQVLGSGDGMRLSFPLVKRYGDGADAEVRRITRPEPGSVAVAVDGAPVAGWALQPMGVVRFDAPPAAGAVVTAGYRFDVPVRFAEDALDIALTAYRAGEVPSVPLLEVREHG